MSQTPEQQRATERLLHTLTRPMYVWRMAHGLAWSPEGHRLAKSATTRRANALAQIDWIVRQYVHDNPTTTESEIPHEPGHHVASG